MDENGVAKKNRRKLKAFLMTDSVLFRSTKKKLRVFTPTEALAGGLCGGHDMVGNWDVKMTTKFVDKNFRWPGVARDGRKKFEVL